jgi:aryl-alcohol dehydrogenase-like predicted oxidoreductase
VRELRQRGGIRAQLINTHGIGVMGYGSLGHGLLTGAFTSTTTFDPARDWRGHGVAFGQPIFRSDNFQTNLGVIERRGRHA